jgi:ATP-dependent Clp protease ATP-binding subunit ClpB
VFHPLEQEQIREIAGIQLGHLRNRLESHGFGLMVSDDALDLLAEAGFDPVYGARPLKRAIQQQLENPLAQKILAGDFASGDTVQVDVSDGRFVFT